MGITAISGPSVSYGITTTSSGGVTEYNEERGPSLSDLGYGLMDPRPNFNYSPGNAPGTPLLSLYDSRGLVDAVPFTSNSSLNYVPGTIVSCLSGSSLLTTLTLNTTVSSAVGVTLSPTVYAPELGTNTTASMACDLVSQWLTFGSAGTVCAWNPANGIARAIAITGSSSGLDDSGVSVNVAGRDLYGYKMSETITLGTSSLNGAIGNKAFKYVNSVTLVNSSLLNSSHINVAFADKFGFPTIAATAGYVTVTYITSNSSTTTTYGASQGISFASTATATATTSDVRGTWTSTAASVVFDGGKRLQVRTTLNPVLVDTVAAGNYAGIFGNTQYST